MLTMPTVFERDISTGLVVPKLNPACAHWIQESQGAAVMITVMLDGVTCKIADGKDGKVLQRKTHTIQTSQGEVTPFIVCRRDRVEDKPYWEAYDGLNVIAAGQYVAYGPEIDNNTQKVPKHIMFRVNPIDNALIIHGSISGIDRHGVSVERFYESCKKALVDGDAYGVVFQVEGPSFQLKCWAKLKRADFGLSWPIPEPPKATDKKCLFFNCTSRLPLNGPAYCISCREGVNIRGTTAGREMKACSGPKCVVLLPLDGPSYCSDCRGKVDSPIGYLTGNSVPSV